MASQAQEKRDSEPLRGSPRSPSGVGVGAGREGPLHRRGVRGAQTPSGGRIVQSTGRGRGAPRVLPEELGRALPPGSTSPRPQRRSPLAGGAGGQAPIRPELPGQQMGIQPQACFPSPPCLNLPLGPLVVPLSGPRTGPGT